MGEEDWRPTLATDRSETARGCRAFGDCYLILWALTILPPVALAALGDGFGGRSFLQLPGDLVRDALHGDLLAIWIVVGSLPMLLIPCWLWSEIKRVGPL